MATLKSDMANCVAGKEPALKGSDWWRSPQRNQRTNLRNQKARRHRDKAEPTGSKPTLIARLCPAMPTKELCLAPPHPANPQKGKFQLKTGRLARLLPGFVLKRNCKGMESLF